MEPSKTTEPRDCSQTNPPVYNCDFCELEFKTKLGFAHHVNQKHNEMVNSAWRKCRYCNYQFPQNGTLQLHMKWKHNKRWKANLKTPKCKTCLMVKKHFTSKCRHCSEGKLEFLKCPFCRVIVSSRQLYLNHVNQKHSIDAARLWKLCRLCSFYFPDSQSLAIHNEKKHPKKDKRPNRSITCVMCSTVFSTHHNYHEHCYNVHKSIASRAWLEKQGHDLPTAVTSIVANATCPIDKSGSKPIVISKDSYQMQSEDGSSFVITPLGDLEDTSHTSEQASSHTSPQTEKAVSAVPCNARRPPNSIEFSVASPASYAAIRTSLVTQPAVTRVSAVTWPVPASTGTTQTNPSTDREPIKEMILAQNSNVVDLKDKLEISDTNIKVSATCSESLVSATTRTALNESSTMRSASTPVSPSSATASRASILALRSGQIESVPSGRACSNPDRATITKIIDVIDLTEESEECNPAEISSMVSRTTLSSVRTGQNSHTMNNNLKPSETSPLLRDMLGAQRKRANFSCTKCSVEFNRYEDLILHWNQNHKKTCSKSSTWTRCSICTNHYPGNVVHFCKNIENKIVERSKFVDVDSSNEEVSVLENETYSRCPLCPSFHQNGDELTNHLFIMHGL